MPWYSSLQVDEDVKRQWYERTARKLSRCTSSARQTGEGISDSGLCTQVLKVKLHVSVIAQSAN
jgi:hypothetical protein